MAKQNTSAGVVQAGQMVAAAENKFVNIGGAFSAGMQSVFEKRRAQEKAVKESKDRLNKKFKTIDIDFNLGDYGLSDEENQIASEFLINTRVEDAALQLAYQGIEDKLSPEAFAITQKRNALRSGVKNFKKDLDKRIELQKNHMPDEMGNSPIDAYSKSQFNQRFIDNLEVATTIPFKSITTDGHMVFENDSTFSDTQLPFMPAIEQRDAIAKMFTRAESMGSEYPEAKLLQVKEEVKNILENNNTVASFLSSDFAMFDNLINEDFKERWSTAFNNGDDLTNLNNELQGIIVDALQDAAKNSIKPDKPSSGRSSRSGSPLTRAQQQTLGYFKQGKNTFKVSSELGMAVAYDDKGTISILADGTKNPAYNGKPNAYVIGTWKNGKFVGADGIGRIPAGDSDKFVQLVF